MFMVEHPVMSTSQGTYGQITTAIVNWQITDPSQILLMSIILQKVEYA